MRRAIILSLMILLSLSLVSATNIGTNTEEDSSGTLSGTYTVEDGATWTISGDYEIADDTSIVIEEGATMIVSGSMNSTQPPQLDLDAISNVTVPVNNIAATGTMRIHFAETVVYGIDIEINNVTTSNWSGSDEFDWTGDMDVENITVNISNNLFNQAVISHVTLSPSGSSPVILAADQLSGEGTSVVVPDKQGSWSIDVQGELIVTGTVFGAAISCYSTCSLDGADMRSSGPINVYGAISVTNSVFANGIIDEDIIVWDDATVTWENSTGTGGNTDNWINLLSTRTIGVGNSYVWFQGFEMGYDLDNTSQLRDNSSFNQDNWGDNIIEIGETKRDRIVRWQDGDGIVHEESASAIVVLSTSWGYYEQQIEDLPRVNHFDVTMDLPVLNFDSLVESSNEGTTNQRLGVMAKVTNSGNAPASFLISCIDGDAEIDGDGIEITDSKDANVGLTVTHTALAGETAEIPMNWDSAKEGDLGLECSIFVPPEFEGYDVVTEGTATSGLVTWSDAGEEASNMLLSITIGVVISVGLFAFIVWRSKQAQADKDYATHLVQGGIETDEETGTIE